MSILKLLPVIVTAAFILSACAGRDAQPIMSSQMSDKDLDCEQLSMEILMSRDEAHQKFGAAESTKNSNIGLGAVGIILVPPILLAMDLTDADKTEANALQRRADHLTRIAIRKDCDV